MREAYDFVKSKRKEIANLPSLGVRFDIDMPYNLGHPSTMESFGKMGNTNTEVHIPPDLQKIVEILLVMICYVGSVVNTITVIMWHRAAIKSGVLSVFHSRAANEYSMAPNRSPQGQTTSQRR